MKARLLSLADALRSSYWFAPSVMAFAAVLLAGGMIWIDTRVGSDWMDGLTWLYAARPNGARQVLSAIGGSMITVAGTVFSVTIASVVFASGQYGPRLLSNFMSDRGNQVTLGTFIATFVYCLLVLRTVRSPEESAGVGFVPNFALLVAVALALCSIAVLIFFIHHVPSKLHINDVIQGVGSRLIAQIDKRYPRSIGDPDPDAARIDPREGAEPLPPGTPMRIAADATGYIQFVDDTALLEQAAANDLVLRLRYQPGDFVHVGRTLVDVWPADRCDDDTAAALAGAFAVGSRRNALQDLRFLIDELVEIAARALSPGVNDPFTAATCLDWLGAALSDLSQRDLPSHLRADEAGDLRVIAYPVSFERFMDRSFGALAQYCATDRVAALAFIDALDQMARDQGDRARFDLIVSYADRVLGLAESGLTGFNLAEVRARAASARKGRPPPLPSPAARPKLGR